jgi:hypothetical protein
MTDIIGFEVINMDSGVKQFLGLLIVVSTVVVLAKIFLQF